MNSTKNVQFGCACFFLELVSLLESFLYTIFKSVMVLEHRLGRFVSLSMLAGILSQSALFSRAFAAGNLTYCTGLHLQKSLGPTAQWVSKERDMVHCNYCTRGAVMPHESDTATPKEHSSGSQQQQQRQKQRQRQPKAKHQRIPQSAPSSSPSSNHEASTTHLIFAIITRSDKKRHPSNDSKSRIGGQDCFPTSPPLARWLAGSLARSLASINSSRSASDPQSVLVLE
ncbi:uncharacterized protein J3D65DRAFT_424000 [Phyllosticta citribraziliensis]|uniref:Uncharacterized protein n=1 Tax=Phyllosticta citribraziliensis TaxID=989973 RepID=A0ABR1LJS5_9PEZI